MAEQQQRCAFFGEGRKCLRPQILLASSVVKLARDEAHAGIMSAGQLARILSEAERIPSGNVRRRNGEQYCKASRGDGNPSPKEQVKCDGYYPSGIVSNHKPRMPR